MVTDTKYTRWAIIASGEGGGRIASQFLTRAENPGIGDRIVVMNTNRTDIRNTIDRLQSELGVDDGLDNAFTFGSEDGAGNNFAKGEEFADKDFSEIRHQLEEGVGIFDDSDAFLYTTTLGGGTGCGSVPYIINELKQDGPQSVTAHMALATWPYEFDGPQQHFNAVSGLSRLLRWYDGEQNADLVLLISNSKVADLVDITPRGFDDTTLRNRLVNEKIIEILDMMISAGQRSRGTIDARDYIEQPSQLDAYHFTPGIIQDIASNFYLDILFDKAAENTFVPLDPTTSRALYAVIQVPENLVGSGEYTETRVTEILEEWLDDRGYDKVLHRNASLKPVDRTGSSVDVLLLFGGFDLRPLLEQSMDHYERHMKIQRESADDASYLQSRQYRYIEQNLEEYIESNEI